MARLVRDIEGLEEVQAVLAGLSPLRWAVRPMQRSVLRVQGHIANYDRSLGPATARYMRGRGPVNAAGKVTRLTSQHLGKRWTNEVRTSGNDIEGIVGNVVSYGPFVHDPDHQAMFHRARGAATTQSVLDSETPWILNEWNRDIVSVLGGNNG